MPPRPRRLRLFGSGMPTMPVSPLGAVESASVGAKFGGQGLGPMNTRTLRSSGREPEEHPDANCDFTCVNAYLLGGDAAHGTGLAPHRTELPPPTHQQERPRACARGL